MKISKEVKIGLIVLTGVLLLFWGVNYLKGKDFFTRQRQVFAVYPQVEGLAASNPVMLNGMKVGLVHQLTLFPENGNILVTMHVSNKFRVPKNSVAEIFSTDLLGSKGVRLVFGDSKEDMQDGDTLVAKIQQSLVDQISAQVGPIKTKAESVMTSLDSVLMVIHGVFNERTKGNLRQSFQSINNSLVSIEHVASTLDTVMTKQGRIRAIFSDLQSITSNFKENNDNITKIIGNFSAISDTIAKSRIAETLDHAQKALEQTATMMEKVNKGEGSLGQLANNDSLYSNLNSSARDLDNLLNDFKQNPKKYLKVSVISFGR